MKREKNYTYRVDFENETIEISKTFATAAQKIKTSAYKQLMDVRKAYPGFSIVIYATEITESKQKYKGLNFDEMRRCIIEWDGEGSANLSLLDKAIANKVPYPKVKQWYLGIYGDYYKRATDVAMPAKEDTADVGNADTTAENC